MIIRRKHTSNFTTIGNALFDDVRLAADEVGILAWLLRQHHDWEVRRPALMRRWKLGPTSTKRIINNWMKFGWCHARKTRLANGTFHIVYEIRDQPGAEMTEDEIRGAFSLVSSEAADDESDDQNPAVDSPDHPHAGDDPPPCQRGVDDQGVVGTGVASIEEATKDGFNKSGGDGDARARGDIPAEAWSLAEEIGAIVGYPTKLDWPPGWCGSPRRVKDWLEAGWDRETALATARAVMANKRDGPPDSIKYFEKAIARAIAQQSAPLPVVKLDQRPSEVIHAQTPRNAADWKQRKDRAHSAIDRFGQALNDAEDNQCGPAGAPVVRADVAS
jgi:hypothetical protein